VEKGTARDGKTEPPSENSQSGNPTGESPHLSDDDLTVLWAIMNEQWFFRWPFADYDIVRTGLETQDPALAQRLRDLITRKVVEEKHVKGRTILRISDSRLRSYIERMEEFLDRVYSMCHRLHAATRSSNWPGFLDLLVEAAVIIGSALALLHNNEYDRRLTEAEREFIKDVTSVEAKSGIVLLLGYCVQLLSVAPEKGIQEALVLCDPRELDEEATSIWQTIRERAQKRLN